MYIKNKVDSLFRSTLLPGPSYDPSNNCIYSTIGARGVKSSQPAQSRIFRRNVLTATTAVAVFFPRRFIFLGIVN